MIRANRKVHAASRLERLERIDKGMYGKIIVTRDDKGKVVFGNDFGSESHTRRIEEKTPTTRGQRTQRRAIKQAPKLREREVYIKDLASMQANNKILLPTRTKRKAKQTGQAVVQGVEATAHAAQDAAARGDQFAEDTWAAYYEGKDGAVEPGKVQSVINKSARKSGKFYEKRKNDLKSARRTTWRGAKATGRGLKIAGKATGREAVRGINWSGQKTADQFKRSMAGYQATPRSWREGLDGIAQNNGKLQRRIDRLSQAAGKKLGQRRKAKK